jgi:hypothetical protein
MAVTFAFAAAALAALAAAQRTAATGECGSAETCTTDGTAAFVSATLTVDAQGKFTGTIKSNGCGSRAAMYNFNGTATTATLPAATCMSQTFPDASITATPAALPSTGIIGMLLNGGEGIFGEAVWVVVWHDGGGEEGDGGCQRLAAIRACCFSPHSGRGLRPRPFVGVHSDQAIHLAPPRPHPPPHASPVPSRSRQHCGHCRRHRVPVLLLPRGHGLVHLPV